VGDELKTVLFIVLCLFVGLWAWARGAEKKNWNEGYCPKCGALWRQYDTDSQGGRGYSCEGGHGIWVSYAVDKKGAPDDA